MAQPNPFEGAQEIQQLIVAYAKQETITPLRSLGRYLGYGMAGALLVFLGAFFTGLGVLRLAQSFEVFAGNSWASTVPYLLSIIVLVGLVALIYVALRRARSTIARPR